MVAQETTGTVRGRIQDAQGLSVPGVTVTVTGVQGSQNAVTDPDGRFNFPFLTPGTYRVRAELQGFKAAEKNNVIVSLGQTVDMPLKMEVGGVTETINVTSPPTVIDLAPPGLDEDTGQGDAEDERVRVVVPEQGRPRRNRRPQHLDRPVVPPQAVQRVREGGLEFGDD